MVVTVHALSVAMKSGNNIKLILLQHLNIATKLSTMLKYALYFQLMLYTYANKSKNEFCPVRSGKIYT
jgi:hypothetical protein